MSAQRKNAASSTGPLHKGKACVNCRRRKVKCDGVKPSCGPCKNSSRVYRDCEYTDGGLTRTQILEDHLTVLEAKIDELQSPEGVESLTLHDPYAHQQHLVPGFAPKLCSTDHEKLPLVLHQTLLSRFAQYHLDLPFFLHFQRFSLASLSPDNEDACHPALLNAMYLWGIHLSENSQISKFEPIFMERAMQGTTKEIDHTDPDQFLQRIQAEVLLGVYFMRNARLLEGKCHIGAVIMLANNAGFYRIRSADPHYTDSTIAASLMPKFPSASTTMEEGERIRAFWTVYCLNNLWGTVLNCPVSAFGSSSMRIDTPWPLKLVMYPQTPIAPTSHTVINFVNNAPDQPEAQSVLTLVAKGSILYRDAVAIARKYHPGVDEAELSQISVSVDSLVVVIQSFAHELLLFEEAHPGSSVHGRLLVYCLLHATIIELHKPLMAEFPESHGAVMSAIANMDNLLKSIDLASIPYYDAMIAILLAGACEALITGLNRLSSQRRVLQGFLDDDISETEFVTRLDSLMSSMNTISSKCRIMKVQLSRIQEQKSSLL